jgi:hypothetical protein
LEQEVRLDLRLLGKSLVAGSIDALKGDWHGSARRLGEAVVGGLGLKDDSSDVLA